MRARSTSERKRSEKIEMWTVWQIKNMLTLTQFCDHAVQYSLLANTLYLLPLSTIRRHKKGSWNFPRPFWRKTNSKTCPINSINLHNDRYNIVRNWYPKQIYETKSVKQNPCKWTWNEGPHEDWWTVFVSFLSLPKVSSHKCLGVKSIGPPHTTIKQ